MKNCISILKPWFKHFILMENVERTFGESMIYDLPSLVKSEQSSSSNGKQLFVHVNLRKVLIYFQIKYYMSTNCHYNEIEPVT